MMVLVLAFWMVATLLPTSAFADGFRIRIEDMTVAGAPNGFGVVIKDDGAGDYFGPGDPGSMTVILDPSWGTASLSALVTTNMTLAFTKPMYADPPTSALLAELKLQGFEVTATGATTVRLTLEDTDYFNPGGPLQIKNSILGATLPAGATITSRSWAGAIPPDLGAPMEFNPDGITLPGPVALSALADITGGALSTSALPNSYAAFTAIGPTYSLFTQLTIVFGAGGGTVKFDQDTTVSVYDALNFPPDPTPEPGSLMLIATGFVGLASRMRRKMFTRG
jgi:hypothetical protein